MLRIGALEVTPPTILAPMAGVTDSPFRRVVRSAGGCGLVTVEFVSSEAMVRCVRSELEKLRFDPDERPIAVQVCGARPEAMAAAAEAVEASGADACDVNMGCPAHPVVRTGAGAALMGDLPLARRILAAMRPRLTIPLTVKFRSGLDGSRLADLELGRICEGEGADALTLHPRTARQQYSGTADWTRIALLKDRVRIPVIGNGDIRTGDDAARMVRETGCDGVMVGRAAVVNPWIFSEVAAVLAGETVTSAPLATRVDLVRRHLEILAAEYEGRPLLHKLRLLARWCSRGFPGGRRLRQRLSAIPDPELLESEIQQFLDHCLAAGGFAGPPLGEPLGR